MKYKVEGQATNSGLTLPLMISVFSALCGMFVFGYNSGVINSPQADIKEFIKQVYVKRYNEAPDSGLLSTLFSLIVAIFALGGVFGGASAGKVAGYLGRKGGLLLTSVVGIVAALFLGLARTAESHEMLFIGRFIVGVACGVYTSLSPMYISEIAPLKYRGTLGVCNQLFVTLGLCISQMLGASWGIKSWEILLGLTGVPCIVQLIFLPFCPESPRYVLLSRGNEEEAVKGFAWLRQQTEMDARSEVDGIKEEEAQGEPEVGPLEIIRTPSLRRPLVIACVLSLAQQLSGINGVLYYSTNVFMSAGLNQSEASSATVGVGGVMVIMTLVSAPFVDRIGRRALMLVGLSGMFVASLAVTASLGLQQLSAAHPIAVVSVLAYVVLFAIGPGSIPWLITSELFSQGPRPSANAIATAVNWLGNFLVGIAFPPLQSLLGYLVFAPFAVLLLLFALFVAFKVPETKQKTFAEISEFFQKERR